MTITTDARPVVVEVDSDTCDACPDRAQVEAFVFVRMPSGRALAYCAHHGTEYMQKLTDLGATIVDRRHLVGK